MEQDDPEEKQSSEEIEPEIAEEDTEALKKALPRRRKRQKVIWLTGKGRRQTLLTISGAANRKRGKLANLPTLRLCLTFYLYLMI